MNEAVKNVIRKDRKKRQLNDIASIVTSPALGYGGYQAGKKIFNNYADKALEKYKDKIPSVKTDYNTINDPVNKDINSLVGKAKNLGAHASGVIGMGAGHVASMVLNNIIARKLTKKDRTNLSEEEIEAKEMLENEKTRDAMITSSVGLAGGVAGGLLGKKLLSNRISQYTNKIAPNSLLNIADNNFVNLNSKNKYINKYVNDPLNKKINEEIHKEVNKSFGSEKREEISKKIDKGRDLIGNVAGAALGAGAGLASGFIAAKILGRIKKKPTDSVGQEKTDNINALRDYVSNKGISDLVGSTVKGYMDVNEKKNNPKNVLSNTIKGVTDSNTFNASINDVKNELIEKNVLGKEPRDAFVNKIENEKVKKYIAKPISSIMGTNFVKDKIVGKATDYALNNTVNPMIEYYKDKARNLKDNGKIKRVDNILNYMLPGNESDIKSLLAKRSSSVASRILSEYLLNLKKA